MADGRSTVLQALHLLNNFDVPMSIENPDDKTLCSATQWTSAIDLTARKVYYKTMFNTTIRCIDLYDIDFERVKYQSHPLDAKREQPIENISVK